MPNQSNYVQLIPDKPQSFSVSRIAESENDKDILETRLPAEFGFDIDDNVELHFYDSGNSLINSTIVPINTGILSIRSLILPEHQREEKLVIDMTRLQTELGLFLPPGTYTLVINLFSNEIGSYDNRKLVVEEVSDSRTEIRLGFDVPFSDIEEQDLFEFTEPSIPRNLAGGVFGGVIGVARDDVISHAIDEQAQTEQFVTEVNTALAEVKPTISAELANIDGELQNDLNYTIEVASATAFDEFVSLLEITKDSNMFDRLQASELDVLIEQAVQNAFTNNNMGLYVQGKIQLI